MTDKASKTKWNVRPGDVKITPAKPKPTKSKPAKPKPKR